LFFSLFAFPQTSTLFPYTTLFRSVLVLQGDGDIVQPLKETLAAVFIHFKGSLKSMVVLEAAMFQVDGELVALVFFRPPKQLFHVFLGKCEGKNPVFEAVVVKNVGKGRGDDHPKSVVQQGPGGVFPGGAAPEIVSGQQDAGSPIPLPVENEIGIGVSLRVVAPIVKQKLTETGPFDPLQKLLGD